MSNRIILLWDRLQRSGWVAFEQSVVDAIGFFPHTIWEDPRAGVCDTPVPTVSDRASKTTGASSSY